MSRSIEAEQSILGAILIDPDANRGAVEHTEPDHFTTDANRAIWQAVQRAFDANQPIDVFTISDALEARLELDMVGGVEYLTGICDSAHSINPVLVRQYWKIVDDHRTRRRVIAAGEAVIMAVREIKDIDELLDEAQRQLNSISQNVNSDTITIDRALDGMLARMEHLNSLKDGEMIGRTTGVNALDEITMGRQAGLHIVAGRPAMGKTVLAMQAVDNMAQDGFASLVISLEMPTDQLVTRSVSAIASLNMQKLKDPRSMTDDDNLKLVKGINLLKDLPIEYLDKMDSKLSRITQTIRSWHRRTSNHGCVVVDYLQLMADGPGDNKNNAVGEITRRFKMLSNELNIPIILVSQLNRSLESRPNKRPIPSDLRDSGSIEQDADSITFVYRDEVYDENTKYKGVAELIVSKQRNGPIGTVYASSEMQYQRFGDLLNYTPPEDDKPAKRGKF